MDKVSRQIAENLRDARTKAGLTQVQLANKAKINSNYYAKIERAEIKPSVGTLEKIVKALGVRSSEIFPF